MGNQCKYTSSKEGGTGGMDFSSFSASPSMTPLRKTRNWAGSTVSARSTNLESLVLGDIFKKVSSNSQLFDENKNNENDDGNAAVFGPEEEPFCLGRSDSFGVGDHYRSSSHTFRTKRFRSKMELGMA